MALNKQPATEKYKGITRIDQESRRSHGWFSRVNFQGQTKTKFFSDKKYGGRQKALVLAVDWRNKTEKKLGKVRTDKTVVTVSKSKTNTGVVGVQYNEKRNRYSATWVTPEGKQKLSSFSVRKYGKEAAFLKACTLRYEKEKIRLESSS